MTPTAKKQTEQIRVPFEVKADSLKDRSFQGLASTWAKDLGNDVIHPGAYARTLSHWRQSGRVIPLLDSHNAWGSINNTLGKMTAAEETDAGLLCTFELVEAGDPEADAAYRRIKSGIVASLSIGYRAIKYDYEQPAGTTDYWDRIRNLYEVELREVSLVIFPMNEGAQIDATSVKTLEAALRAGTLTPEQKQQIRALLDAPAPTPGDEPAVGTEEKGLAPEDPERLALEAELRGLTLRSLGAR